MFHPSKGNLDSRIFCYWNTKSSNFIGFGIRNTAQGILNPTDDKNRAESSTSSPQSKVWNHKFKTVSDSLTWGEIFILYLFIHLVSSPLCCEHHLLEVNTTSQINATSIFFCALRQTNTLVNKRPRKRKIASLVPLQANKGRIHTLASHVQLWQVRHQ